MHSILSPLLLFLPCFFSACIYLFTAVVRTGAAARKVGLKDEIGEMNDSVVVLRVASVFVDHLFGQFGIEQFENLI